MLVTAPPPPARRRLDAGETARALAALRDLLGADRVDTGADALAQHARDESGHAPAPPDAVVRPEGVDEVAAVVRTCRAHDLPVVPFGAGTSLEGQATAPLGGLSLDLRAMDRVLRLSVEDLDVTVQAGVTRRALEAHLRPHGVFFPVDPGADATLGGMASTAASGTTTVRHGPMRENVLGLTAVTAAGDVIRTGGRARKTASGYDLTRLLVGAEGTLAVIVELDLRLRPTPEAVSAAVAAFPTLGDAVRCVHDVEALGIPVERIELLDAAMIRAVNARDGLAHPEAPTLFLELAGSPATVAEQTAELAAVAAEHGCRRLAHATDEAERRALWHARHGAYEAARATRPGCAPLPTDACVPVSALADCVEATNADLRESGLVGLVAGHVGDGNFHTLLLLDPDDAAEAERATAFHDRLVRRAIAMGGTCSGEHGVGTGKAGYLDLEHGTAAVDAMAAVKHALDPADLLNPGKLFQAPAARRARASAGAPRGTAS